MDSWVITEGGMGEPDLITLPYEDLSRIIKNRLRWRAWGRAWEVQRLGSSQIAEVASGG